MRRPPLMLAALAMLAACATAPEPEPAPPQEAAGATAGFGQMLEEQATALLAAEPAGAVPPNLRVTILSVEETAAGLFYNAELTVPGRRREDRDYIIYGQCPAADLASCASQIVSGARMLAKD